MKIQSLSIVIPTKRCVNDCPFCVSKMHDNEYENIFDDDQIKKRLKYAVNNGVNTLIFTGTGEVLQNRNFLIKISKVLKEMGDPFPNIELQTTGVFLSDTKRSSAKWCINLKLLKEIGVNTINLSINSILSDKENMGIAKTPKHLQFELENLISIIKSENFNVRLSLNMTADYDMVNIEKLFGICKNLKADQITFRQLYSESTNSPQSQWVKDNSCHANLILKIKNYIKTNGKILYQLPYGPIVYSIQGMSTVLDDDCMSIDNYKTLKYLILREDGKLYCRWDDKGSLIF